MKTKNSSIKFSLVIISVWLQMPLAQAENIDLHAFDAVEVENVIGRPQRSYQHEGDAASLLRRQALAVASSVELNEQQSESFAELIRYVASSKFYDATDVLLLRPILTSGAMAVEGVSRQGHRAINKLLVAYNLNISDDAYRQSTAMTLQNMIESGGLTDPDDRKRALSLLETLLSDHYPYVRINAIRGLRGSKNPSLRQQIASMAMVDPYFIVDGDHLVWPVREEAAAMLLVK